MRVTDQIRRMTASMWRQRTHLQAEREGRLDGRHAVVTGGNGGIGLETARGLLARGARVTLLCRSERKARAASDVLGGCDFALADLGDLGSIAAATDSLGQIDVLIANAGIWPMKYAETADGFEIAFGVNVLGHALLVERLARAGQLVAGSRVVWVTGDIYVLESDCTPDYRYRWALGGQWAYCRSKLGNLWMRAAFEREWPDIAWYAVHPGVVRTHLGGDKPGPDWLLDAMMISPAEGARTSISCAAADLQPGYYHNTLGRMELGEGDPGADLERARALYAQGLGLLRDHLPGRP